LLRFERGRDPAAPGPCFTLGHFLDAIHTGFVGTLGNKGFTAGRHTGTGTGRGELFGHGGVNPIRLIAAKLVRRHQDLVGVAIITLGPVMTVVDNAVNVLVNLNHPFVNYNPAIFFSRKKIL
jgi:hypothetical protein